MATTTSAGVSSRSSDADRSQANRAGSSVGLDTLFCMVPTMSADGETDISPQYRLPAYKRYRRQSQLRAQVTLVPAKVQTEIVAPRSPRDSA